MVSIAVRKLVPSASHWIISTFQFSQLLQPHKKSPGLHSAQGSIKTRYLFPYSLACSPKLPAPSSLPVFQQVSQTAS